MKWEAFRLILKKVTISGPESIINKIDKVVAKIDVTGMKESNVELDSETENL